MSSPHAAKSPPPPDRIQVIVATDCGSTTTKAILIERFDEGGRVSWRQTQRAEAPTTVEEPFADVTIGARLDGLDQSNPLIK
jgi:hypothetical protein